MSKQSATPPPLRSQPCRRSGMTLVELLVVVAILIVLVSVTTAMMQPVLSGQQTREAARQLNGFIAASLARAAQTGRPAGIWIERSSSDADAAFDIFMAEVPPLYAGDTLDATASFTAANTASLSNATSLGELVMVGDLIRFSYSGPWYPIQSVSGTDVTFTVGDWPAPPADANNVPFQIQRGPRKSPAPPLQMPGGTVIDLKNSGIGNGTMKDIFKQSSGDTSPVIIMFRPDGSVDRVYYNNMPELVIDSIYLLVGRPGDNIGSDNLGTEPNENLWVAINPQAGTVITAENMGGDFANARQFAIAGKGMGGR